jgi:hypothetical protein
MKKFMYVHEHTYHSYLDYRQAGGQVSEQVGFDYIECAIGISCFLSCTN